MKLDFSVIFRDVFEGSNGAACINRSYDRFLYGRACYGHDRTNGLEAANITTEQQIKYDVSRATQFTFSLCNRNSSVLISVTTALSVVVQNNCRHFAYFQISINKNSSHSSIFVLLGSRLENKWFLNFPVAVIPKHLEFWHIYEKFIGYRFVASFCILRNWHDRAYI